jgi:16S rRNA (cytosine1402-N4)-methyltransferase
MDDSPPQIPRRRKRYSGKNPRRFEDKYKELDPVKHAETIAKVIESGKTPAGMHLPVLVDECLEALQLEPGLKGVDATLGFGGHATEILSRICPGGLLLGLDIDPIEQPKTEARLREAGYSEETFKAIRSNYAGIRKVLDAQALDTVDFVFADLGCSSMQIDDPRRGFTWKSDGPLDMRMNPGRGIPASEWLEKVKPDKLAAVLIENADEPLAESIAAALAGKSVTTTKALSRMVRALPELAKLQEERADLTVRRVFQAIRIAVNEEFAALDSFLRMLPACLKDGGRVAILTFHSGEDRRVKKSFQAGLKDGIWSAVSDAVIVAGNDERRSNPRSTPAKLRWAVKAPSSS